MDNLSVRNLLENWKKEGYLLSSSLSVQKKLNRTDVDYVYQTLVSYFGSDYFNITYDKTNSENQHNWLHCLLVNYNRPATILALYEVAHLLVYLQGLDKLIQEKFKSLLSDNRQFRDMFFELYVSRLLEFNGIHNTKSPKEGNKELDLLFNINGQEYLGECFKIYAPNPFLLGDQKHIVEQLYLRQDNLNKGLGLLGIIKFKKSNSFRLKIDFEKKIDRFIEEFKSQQYNGIDYHDIDGDMELHIVNYDLAKSIEIEYDETKYDIFFKITPHQDALPNTPNMYGSIVAKMSIPQARINEKISSALNRKTEQHLNSKYEKKIYFIDSESVPDFVIPIFPTESTFDRKKIQEYVDTFSDNEVFCFIRRNYMLNIPIVSIETFGKNINPVVKMKLDGLKTNFAYELG